MSRVAIADTGPIFAFLSPYDLHREWAVAQFAQFEAPLLTCEAVLSEVTFLVRSRTATSPSIVLEMVQEGVLKLAFDLAENLDRVHELCARYGSRMSLADGCLVRLSELLPDATVLTTDRVDFETYRRHGRQNIPFAAP